MERIQRTKKASILPKWKTLLLGVSLAGVLFAEAGVEKPALKVVNVGITHDGPWRRMAGLDALIKKETQELVRHEWEVRFPKRFELDGKWSYASIKKGVDSLLANKEVDIIIALGIVASDIVSHYSNLNKPVIAPLILDQRAQNIPLKEGGSGVKNLSYLVSSKSFERSLEVFHRVVPFRHVAVLIDSLIPTIVPSFAQFAKTVEKQSGYQIHFIPVGASISAIPRAMPATVDAVVLTPLLKLTESDVKGLSSFLIKRKLPSFSILGGEEVEQGIMMSIAPPADYDRFARRIALILHRVLMGEEAGKQNVLFTEGEQLVINMTTTRLLDARPSWEVLAEAELVQEEKPANIKKLTLLTAIQEAMSQNKDVLVASQDVKTSKQDKNKALADLLPRLEAEYDYKQVDEDQAMQSFGAVAEREQTGHLTLTQTIFSEPAWSNWSVRARLQEEKHLALQNTILDAGLEAAKAYLNSLKAKTFERVRKSDLKLTRSNLERAKARQLIGVANASEVYRWETQIATKKKDYLASIADTGTALIALNRTLSFAQTTPLDLEEADLTDPKLLISDKRLDRYLNDPWSVAVFNEFVVEAGLENSVELKRFQALIAAQKRQLDSVIRAHYLPSVHFQAKEDEIFSREGAGSELLEKEENAWSLGVTATLPLITGGAQIVEVKKAREELTRLEFEYERTKLKVEQRIRNALYKINASYAGIELSEQGREAARKTLNFVTDSYARGAVPIIDLIDAQNSSFASEQSAANAAYDFLLDLMELQRAVAQFDFFLEEGQREAFFKRLTEYFRTRDKRAAA